MNDQMQQDESAFGIEPGEFKSTGLLLGATILGKNVMGPKGYRGVPLLRDLLGGQHAGVALSKTMRNARLAGAGLGAMFGGPLGALVGLVGANYVGSEGLLQTFMNKEGAHRIAYGKNPIFENKYGTLGDLKYSTIDEIATDINDHIDIKPSSPLKTKWKKQRRQRQEIVKNITNDLDNSGYSKISSFIGEERNRDIDVIRSKHKYEHADRLGAQIKDEIESLAKGTRELGSYDSHRFRENLGKFNATGSDIFASQGLAAMQIFGGTVSQSMDALQKTAMKSSGVLTGRFANMRYILGKKQKAAFRTSYESAVRTYIKESLDGVPGAHYIGESARHLKQEAFDHGQHRTLDAAAEETTKKRRHQKRKIIEPGVTRSETFDAAVSREATLRHHIDIFKEFDMEDESRHLLEMNNRYIEHTKNGNTRAADRTRRNMDTYAKTHMPIQEMPGSAIPDMKTKAGRIKHTVNTGVNKIVGRASNEVMGKAMRGLAMTALKYTTIGQITLEVASLTLRGLWTGTNKLNNAIGKMSRREFGSGRAVTTDMATSERQRAMQAIQTNRMQATSFLGMEARNRAMNGYQ